MTNYADTYITLCLESIRYYKMLAIIQGSLTMKADVQHISTTKGCTMFLPTAINFTNETHEKPSLSIVNVRDYMKLKAKPNPSIFRSQGEEATTLKY